MSSQPAAVPNPSAGVLKPLGWLVLGLSVVLVIVAVVLPPHVLSWLSSDVWLFGQSLKWLEAISTRVDLVHVILFGWVGFLLSCLWRRSPWWRIALLLVGLAVATELLQFLVPGRTPRISDLYDDLLGVAIGVVSAIPLRWFARRKQAQ